MRLPSFSELVPEQRDVFLNAPEESILVVGPPGSGKTSTALWKAAFLKEQRPASNVILVTRNRLLAALAAQISQDQGKPPVVCKTMSAFLNGDHHQRFGGLVPQAPPHNYTWLEILQKYQDYAVQPTVDHLIVDEGQNLPFEFFVWALRHMAKKMSVFADEDQNTDGKGTRIAQLQSLGYEKVLPLTFNHRNSEQIAALAEYFHRNSVLPPAKVERGRSLEAPELINVLTWNELAKRIAIRAKNRGGAIGVITYRKEDVLHLAALISAEMPADYRVDKYTSDAEPRAEDAIKMRDDGVTVISGESATGLEFPTVYLQDLSRSLPIATGLEARRLYVLSTRARDSLFLVNGPGQLNAAQLAHLPLPPLLER